MRESLSRRESPEAQRRLLEEELYRLYGPERSDMRWVSETLARLETQHDTVGYTEKNLADLTKAQLVLDRMEVVSRFYNSNQPRDDHGRWTSGGALPNAVKYLDSHTKPLNELTPKERENPNCAKIVREALAQDGIDIKPADRPSSGFAKDYGPALKKSGFEEVVNADRGAGPPNRSTLEAGDVVVIQDIPGHSAGHMAMWTGSRWISYFKQENFWPHRDYGTISPPYVIYRQK
jgi:hypothetical protein